MHLGIPNTDLADRAPVIVVGGGPAGLTAALELTARGRAVTVLEGGDQVGGLARTVERDGYRFDLGGHRFFTKQPEIELIWHELLGEELLLRPRRSRIRWRGRFIEYPLRVGDLIANVGPVELGRIGASYARSRLRPEREAVNFEQWVTDRFGRRLFENFFHSYTEKVWGVPTDRISADWAAQRIRKLSVGEAVRAAFGRADRGHHSLIDEFLYPRLGPGQLWEAMRTRIEDGGGKVRTDSPVAGFVPPAGSGGPARVQLADGEELEAAAVISSAPLGALARMLPPRSVPSAITAAASELRHRDFLTVALILDGPSPFPDNWIYVHDPEVAVGRVQNFAAWSEAMVSDPSRSCLGLEYFCFAGDELWSQEDEQLVARARREIEAIGLASAADVVAGHVVRVPAAYPIYGEGYAARIALIREWVETMPWLQQIGRNGLHRYNNVDHSMLTAIRAVENVCEGAHHDLWAVNADSAYHEEGEREVVQQPYLGPAPRPAAADAPALQEIS